MPATAIKTATIDTILTACADKAHASKCRMKGVAILVDVGDATYLVAGVDTGQIDGRPALILKAGEQVEEKD